MDRESDGVWWRGVKGRVMKMKNHTIAGILIICLLSGCGTGYTCQPRNIEIQQLRHDMDKAHYLQVQRENDRFLTEQADRLRRGY